MAGGDDQVAHFEGSQMTPIMMTMMIVLTLHMVMAVGFLWVHEAQRAEEGWGRSPPEMPDNLAAQSYRDWFEARKNEQSQKLYSGFQDALFHDYCAQHVANLQLRLENPQKRCEVDDEYRAVCLTAQSTLPDAGNIQTKTVRGFVAKACENAMPAMTLPASVLDKYVDQGLREVGTNVLPPHKNNERAYHEEVPFSVKTRWETDVLPDNLRELARRVLADLQATRKSLAKCQKTLVVQRSACITDIGTGKDFEEKMKHLKEEMLAAWSRELSLLPEVTAYFQNSNSEANAASGAKENTP